MKYRMAEKTSASSTKMGLLVSVLAIKKEDGLHAGQGGAARASCSGERRGRGHCSRANISRKIAVHCRACSMCPG